MKKVLVLMLLITMLSSCKTRQHTCPAYAQDLKKLTIKNDKNTVANAYAEGKRVLILVIQVYGVNTSHSYIY